tara:strand:+ start:8663 stop:9733 length:1071 start_codon:yes stop_codon:yes gene_type:complete
MIKTGSSYYITTPFVSPASGLTCTSYTISVFIWDGLKASIPGTANYTITKKNPTGSIGSDEIDIAKEIADFIDFTARQNAGTGKFNADNNVWFHSYNTYITTLAADATTQQNHLTQLASLGYSYGNEGENITAITNNILLSGIEFKVDRAGFFSLPVLGDESSPMAVTVISYPDNEINYSASIVASTTSSVLVQNIWVDLSETTTDTYVEIGFNGITTTLLIQDELKYTPLDILFQNKEGGQQFLTFFKERTDELTVTDNSYESFRGQPSLGNHQFIRFNVQGEESFKVNSGWVDEVMNETFIQLLLSERIWSYDGVTFTPLDIKSKQLTLKTQQKERLINYEIQFKPSYNKINNV